MNTSQLDGTQPDTPAPDRRYRAFISYRHSDNKEKGRQWATWLHQYLEGYRVPKPLVGTKNLRGETVDATLFPVFRDEEELPADADLSNNITRALRNSDALVVICSPRATQSRFVAEEIRYFKELGRSGHILALIIDGEPNASDDPGKRAAGIDPALECFPEPLRFGVAGEDGRIDWTHTTEPIAADVRPEGRPVQGFTSATDYATHLQKTGGTDVRLKTADYAQRLQLARTKIVAGILGVPLGVLTERDKQQAARRRRQRLLAAVAAAVLVVVTTISLMDSWKSRREAKSFETAANSGGVIMSPKTPTDCYHNATLLGERGEFDKAVGYYRMVFANGGQYLDALDSLRKLADASNGHISEERVAEIIRPSGSQFQLCLCLLEGKTNAAVVARSLLDNASSSKPPLPVLLTLKRVLSADLSLGNTYSGRTMLQDVQNLINEQGNMALAACYLNPLSASRVELTEISSNSMAVSGQSNMVQSVSAPSLASIEANNVIIPRVFFNGQEWKLGLDWNEQYPPPSMAYPPEYIVTSPDLPDLVSGTNLFAAWRGSKPKDIGEEMSLASWVSVNAEIALGKKPPEPFRLKVAFKEATGVTIVSYLRVFLPQTTLADPASLVDPDRLKWQFSPISSSAFSTKTTEEAHAERQFKIIGYLTIDNRPERFDMCILTIQDIVDNLPAPASFQKFKMFIAELPEWRGGVDVLNTGDMTRLVYKLIPVSKFSKEGEPMKPVGESEREEALQREKERIKENDVRITIPFHYCYFYRKGLHLKVETCTSNGLYFSTFFEVPPLTNNCNKSIGLLPVSPETFTDALASATSVAVPLEDTGDVELTVEQFENPFKVVAQFTPDLERGNVTLRALNASLVNKEIATSPESTLMTFYFRPENGALEYPPHAGVSSVYLIGEWKGKVGNMCRSFWRVDRAQGGAWLNSKKTINEELDWAVEHGAKTTGQ